ncbi:hypothetical protein ACTMU2_33890, partial [Cupriavidus basilensis]
MYCDFQSKRNGDAVSGLQQPWLCLFDFLGGNTSGALHLAGGEREALVSGLETTSGVAGHPAASQVDAGSMAMAVHPLNVEAEQKNDRYTLQAAIGKEKVRAGS